ncbi:LysM peptidoglycan-binding domain-containing protein [bacterium]|nr:LysM peptidoglycan-binding domain-containing protein [bacterium]
MRRNPIRSLIPARLALVLMLLLPPAVQFHAYAEETAAPASAEATPTISDETPFVSIDGVDYTLGKLKVAASFRQIGTKSFNPETELKGFRGERLEDVARTIGAWNSLAAEAAKAGLELSEARKTEADRFLDRYAGSVLFRQWVTDKMPKLDEEALRKEYEATKADKFPQAEELRLRQIFLSTYKPYTVKEGDTLESIAKEQSGDEAAAARILSNETKRPRAEETESADEGKEQEKLPPRALVAGESLMVPMSETEAAAVLAKANEAIAKINGDTGFVAVANEYSENQRPGELWVVRPKSQDRPILSEITETFFKLKDGEMSEPVRTKHGYHIILREAYVPEGFRPFSEVEGVVRQDLENKAKMDLTAAFFNSVIDDSGLVKLHAENIAKSKQDESPDDVILTIDGKDINRQTFNSASRRFLEEDANRNVDAVKAQLSRIGLMQGSMVSAYRKLPVFADLPETKAFVASMNEVQLAQTLLEKRLDEEVKAPTDEEIAAQYEAEKDRYKTPETFDLAKIEIKELETTEPGSYDLRKQELTAALKSVTSLEEFRALANEVRKQEDGVNTPEDGKVGKRRASEFITSVAQTLRDVKTPGLSAPIDNPSGLYTYYWVSAHEKEGLIPIADVKERIADQLKQKAREERQTAIIDELKAKATVKLLIE